MTDTTKKKRFAVIGSPVAHSRSPSIHELFAKQLGINLRYDVIDAPAEEFEMIVQLFFAGSGLGLNITLPYKEEAYALLPESNVSQEAKLAQAVNTLWMEDGSLLGANTDGVGLLADIKRLGVSLKNKNILLIGAGGAAKGVTYPLLNAQCASLRIVNRTADRALQLLDHIKQELPQFANRVSGGGLDQAQGQWDVVINATSSSLNKRKLDLPSGLYAQGALAYDMFYAAKPTLFMEQAQADGATLVSDGLGMLVAQAAASFFIWHRQQPDIEPVIATVRSQLNA